MFRSRATSAGSRTSPSLAGLTSRGPNQAGGSVFDDFNGDGLPDLFTTSLDADLGASLFLNRGDGTFEDRSASAGLGDQVYALNVPAPTSTTTATWTCCCCAAAGSSRCGFRCCGTGETAPSMT